MPSVLNGSTDVLVADDDELIRMVVRAALEASGCRVIEASDGDSAIREVSERTVTAHPVRVAVLDSHMPGPGLDAVVTALEQFSPAPSIVVLSGDLRGAASLSAGLATPAPRRRFLAKPVELDDLIDAVTTMAATTAPNVVDTGSPQESHVSPD